MTKTIEKFLRYVQVDTCSDEASTTFPSTQKQHELAGILAGELEAIGAREIHYDKEHCYVYASIPATQGCEDGAVLGFIAHMDTAPAFSGTGVKPRIVEQYDGCDIVLNKELGISLNTSDFPELLKYKGKDLIVTDGTTLLGADDKAGIAEIMAMAEYLIANPQIRHGKIRIGFTPDEEVGCGADHFDVALFGADFAYTVDGGELGELEYENFNAAGAKVTFQGRSVHPGSAKGKMKNAILLAQEFQACLPVFENPMYTEKYEGFYHLDSLKGNVDEAVSEYIIRDHDKSLFEAKKETMKKTAGYLNEKYGQGTVMLDVKDSYYNMKEILEPHMHLVENAFQAMMELGIEPIVSPIRGGTDGARLSFMGLPCPNLCAGGENFHGRYEYVCVQSMNSITELLVEIARKYAAFKK